MSIRKLLLVAVCAIPLSGCAGWLESDDPLAEKVKAVQNYTKELCKFLPTVASVTAVLTSASASTTGTFAVASAICIAVTRQESTATLYKDPCPLVNGVCIEGEFVDTDDTDVKPR